VPESLADALVLGSGPDRFALPAEVLRRFHGHQLDPMVPEPWFEPMLRAGVHPASLVLCCLGQAFALVEPLKHALSKAGLDLEMVPDLISEIVAWSPLTYAHDIQGWELRPKAGADLLPHDLLAVRGLTVRGGPLVKSLGRGWAVVGGLRVEGLVRLEALDGPLEVFGDLELDGLPRLRGLGSGIRIHGSLTLAGCPALEAWPDDLRVDGEIWLDAAGPVPAGPELARRMVTPWPGIRPRPVPMPPLPAGAQWLATR
jgi:hypothetical protein